MKPFLKKSQLATAALATVLVLCPGTAASLGGATDLADDSSNVPTAGERVLLCENILKDALDVYMPTAMRLTPEMGYPRSISSGHEWWLSYDSSWTSGFFAGILWQLYDRFGNERMRDQAERWTVGLENQALASTHDVGFIINSSFGRGYRATGEEHYRDVVLVAAQTLAGRFDTRVGAIKSWDSTASLSYPVLIDAMMNIELLFWAAENGGDPSLADIAREHAETTARDFVRDDGTTFQLVDYEPTTGEMTWCGTVQGMSDVSTWSRGQAWALYGFTVAFRETGHPLFLETACRTADAFISRMPEDVIPCWDFDAEVFADEPRDASAAAVAASGLWELASMTRVAGEAERYRTASLALTERLSRGDYSALEAGLPALLLHSTGNRPVAREVDVPLIYADYYFIEALTRQLSSPAPAVDQINDEESGVDAGDVTHDGPPAWLRGFPNPFHGLTRIAYCVPTPGGRTTVRVYSASGRLVRTIADTDLGPGEYTSEWDGRDDRGAPVAAGVHFCRVEAAGRAANLKLLFLP